MRWRGRGGRGCRLAALGLCPVHRQITAADDEGSNNHEHIAGASSRNAWPWNHDDCPPIDTNTGRYLTGNNNSRRRRFILSLRGDSGAGRRDILIQVPYVLRLYRNPLELNTSMGCKGSRVQVSALRGNVHACEGLARNAQSSICEESTRNCATFKIPCVLLWRQSVLKVPSAPAPTRLSAERRGNLAWIL